MADSNKTEQATPRHRQEARKRGQVTRSRELSGALSMSAVAGVIFLMGTAMRFRIGPTSSAHTLELASSDSIEPNGPLALLDQRRSDALGLPDCARGVGSVASSSGLRRADSFSRLKHWRSRSSA